MKKRFWTKTLQGAVLSEKLQLRTYLDSIFFPS